MLLIFKTEIGDLNDTSEVNICLKLVFLVPVDISVILILMPTNVHFCPLIDTIIFSWCH